MKHIQMNMSVNARFDLPSSRWSTLRNTLYSRPDDPPLAWKGLHLLSHSQHR